MAHCLLESRVEDGVEDVSGVIHGPELSEDCSPDWGGMEWREEVAEQATQLLIELTARADGVALSV